MQLGEKIVYDHTMIDETKDKLGEVHPSTNYLCISYVVSISNVILEY